MKTTILIMILATTTMASQLTAYWTGKSYTSTSVSGKFVTNCEYSVYGVNGKRLFWRAFEGTCKSSVQVF